MPYEGGSRRGRVEGALCGAECVQNDKNSEKCSKCKQKTSGYAAI
jgi:hypothetical protein